MPRATHTRPGTDSTGASQVDASSDTDATLDTPPAIRQYVGPPADVLVLPSGVRVSPHLLDTEEAINAFLTLYPERAHWWI